MTLVRTDPAQLNLVDGSIYMHDVQADGMYVTVKGNNPDQPIILSFDPEDIRALRDAVTMFDEFHGGAA